MEFFSEIFNGFYPLSISLKALFFDWVLMGLWQSKKSTLSTRNTQRIKMQFFETSMKEFKKVNSATAIDSTLSLR